jgi:diaminohydroxyphosphoribosylaminopyrimidine deaminase/5-amino-6-(5-phosphoribosylamino)uracil reductase
MRVTLKLATTLDGKIATQAGESRWITGPEARAQVHRLRAAHEAIMVGVETVIADDPELTVRLEGYQGPQPVRVALDSGQRIPPASRLVAGAREVPTWVVAVSAPNNRLTDAGVTVIEVEALAGRVDPAAALRALADRGLKSVMIEGGGKVAASFLSAGLVDAIEWFRAPIVIGEAGRPAIGAMAVDALAGAPRFVRLSAEAVGADLWERYART